MARCSAPVGSKDEKWSVKSIVCDYGTIEGVAQKKGDIFMLVESAHFGEVLGLLSTYCLQPNGDLESVASKFKKGTDVIFSARPCDTIEMYGYKFR